MKVDVIKSESGFTLIEVLAVLVLLAVLAVYATPKFIDLTDDAQESSITAVLGALESGEALVKASYFAKGSPGLGASQNIAVTISDIPVRFNNGQIRTTLDSNHVPTGPQNRNSAYTRLFFLFLNEAPGEIVRRNSTGTGWVMLGNNNSCATGVNPRRCWEYRDNGNRVARITYFSRTGVFVRD